MGSSQGAKGQLPEPFRQMDVYTIAIQHKAGTGAEYFQIAGPGSRAAAGAFDLLIQAATGLLFYSWFIYGNETIRGELKHPLAAVGLIIEWHVVYMMLFESFTGGITPGKKLLGVRVYDLTGQGRCRPLQAVLRNVIRIVDFLPIGYLIGWALSVANSKQQRLGDLLAKTVVVYHRPLNQQLDQSRVPASFFSTSEDGYLLEAWERRRAIIETGLEKKLSRDLALYLHARYGEAGTAAMQAYESEDYGGYLELLLAEERRDGRDE